VKLTENINMYNVFVDPKFIRDKKKFIDIMTPIIYKHLCEVNGMKKPDKLDCIKNVEYFSQNDLLPEAPEFFYFGKIDIGSGMFMDKVSTGSDTYDWTWFYAQVDQVVSWFNQWIAYGLIRSRLDERIYVGIKKRNYLW